MLKLDDFDFKGLKRTRKVNGENTIELTAVPTESNKDDFPLIVEEATLNVFDKDYVIKQLNEKSKGKKYVKQATAIHDFFVNLINKQQPIVHNGSITFKKYMEDMVFAGTGYKVVLIDSFAAREFENLGDDNRLALLSKGVDRFKAEFELVGDEVRFYKQIGRDTDFQFRFGHNIKAISVDINTRNLATKIEGTGDPELGIEASYTSPNVDIFGEIDAPPVRDERYKSNTALLEELKARIVDEPEASITVDFADLRAAGYPYTIPGEGDRIWLIYEPMDDLLVEVRIMEIIEYFDNYMRPIKTEVTLSNHKKSLAGSMMDNVQKQLSDIATDDGVIRYSALDEAVRIATEALHSAQTELEFNNGIIAREKGDPNRLVLLNSGGIGISDDGGQTFREAITADGFVLTAGAIGRLSANHIQIGADTEYENGYDPSFAYKNFIVDGEDVKTNDDLIISMIYYTHLKVSDLKNGDKLPFSIETESTVDGVIEIILTTSIFEPEEFMVSSTVAEVFGFDGFAKYDFIFDVDMMDMPQDEEFVFVCVVDNSKRFKFRNAKLTKQTPSSDIVDNINDNLIREDLRLASPLPTSITMNNDGITAYVPSSQNNYYARLDHRGLYIKGGAIQIDGGLSDSQISSSGKWNGQGTYIDSNGIYTGTLTANQIQTSFNGIGSQVKITSAGLSTYRGGLRTSLLNGDGHHFYREGTNIGYIGTQNWINDESYRGLSFGLEYNADYMAWGFRESAGASTYTTMLSWHKTSAKDNKGFTFSDDVTFNLGISLGNNNSTINTYSNAIDWAYSNNVKISQFENGQVQFHMGSSTSRHTFYSDGSKKGGSIEVDNEVYGMSPIDSPQVLIEYIEFDIELSSAGIKVFLNETYTKAVNNFAVFLNNGSVIEKGDNYFVAAGEGFADARVVGKRIEYDKAFWGEMEDSSSLENSDYKKKPLLRMASAASSETNKTKNNWFVENERVISSESIDGIERSVLTR